MFLFETFRDQYLAGHCRVEANRPKNVASTDLSLWPLVSCFQKLCSKSKILYLTVDDGQYESKLGYLS